MKRLLKVMRYTRNEPHRLPRVGPCVGAVGSEGSPGETVNSLGKHKKALREDLWTISMHFYPRLEYRSVFLCMCFDGYKGQGGT